MNIENALRKAVSKYGAAEQLCFADHMMDNWNEHISTAAVPTAISSEMDLRNKLINQGRILEENADEHYAYWLIRLTGLFAPEAIVVTILGEGEIHIGAYANDGRRSKNRADQAIEQVRKALSK